MAWVCAGGRAVGVGALNGRLTATVKSTVEGIHSIMKAAVYRAVI